MSVEPILVFDGDGIDFYTENGHVLSGDQVFNCVLFLLFTDSNNFHHDVFLKNQNWKFRGNYIKTLKRPINMQMLADLGKAIEKDLKPLIDDGIIFNLDSISKNTSGKRIESDISFIYNSDPLALKITFENDKITVK